MTGEFAIALIGAGSGLIGVLIGACITWFQAFWTQKQERDRKARYLAIRIVCILDKFVEDCVAVVQDHGMFYEDPRHGGSREWEVKEPGAPIYPDDVDWTSINQELMYKILALPSDIEATDKIIKRGYALYTHDHQI